MEKKLASTINDLLEYQDINSITGKYPQITKNQLRWIVANKERFKIDHAIKRIGRRLYFHIPSLLEWISKQDA
jgi:hypothetical protein